MIINELLRSAILPVVPVCEPHSYDGVEPVYCVFNYVIIPWTYADGMPLSVNYSTQVHLYMPLRLDPLDLISQISLALQCAGFPCPEIQDASDKASQHYVFEFSHIVYESDVVSHDREN